ncbi:MAG TPA: FAD-dependent oxidoreductase [Actinomycetota bacterium]|nr:FAD-dependent oxidoreductase [Actinomycetota bacterium]
MAVPEAVGVAVVGGGVIGLSVARELRRAGVDRVVVLEREASVGQGSSSRANGGVRAQFTTRANIAFSAFSIAELERLEAATGLLGFHQTGYLLLCGTEAGEAGLAEAFELQRSLGVDVRWLAPDEALAMVPFLRPDGLRAATFHARDGFLDPHGVVAALRGEADRLDVRVLTGTEVTAVEPGPGGALDVRAGDRTLRAQVVVNAAGPAAGQVAALCGVDLPVAPVRRNLAYVREPDGAGPLIPMSVDLDTGVLVRREASGGFVVAWSNPDDPSSWDTAVDPRFLEQLAARVGNRFPLLEDLPLDPRQCWAGLYPETPDHHAVIGPDPELPALVHCAGFGGHGVMHSPAAGRAVAELVSTGSCATFDLHPLRPSRFAEGDLIVETAVL